MKEKTMKKSFMKGIKKEWKMIHWPNKKLLAKQTFVVLTATVLITLLCVLANANAVAILKFLG